jgi:hypothetical protein
VCGEIGTRIVDSCTVDSALAGRVIAPTSCELDVVEFHM